MVRTSLEFACIMFDGCYNELKETKDAYNHPKLNALLDLMEKEKDAIEKIRQYSNREYNKRTIEKYRLMTSQEKEEWIEEFVSRVSSYTQYIKEIYEKEQEGK